MSELLIRGGTLIDGTGRERRRTQEDMCGQNLVRNDALAISKKNLGLATFFEIRPVGPGGRGVLENGQSTIQKGVRTGRKGGIWYPDWGPKARFVRGLVSAASGAAFWSFWAPLCDCFGCKCWEWVISTMRLQCS